MRNKIFILLVVGTFFSLIHQGTATEFYLAPGYSSVTRGRTIPLLYFAMQGKDMGLSISTVGTQNDLAYQSYYNLVIHANFKDVNFLGGTIKSSTGLGLHYNKIGLKETKKSSLNEKSSFQVGPSLRVMMVYGHFFFFGMENIFGLFETWTQISKITIVPAHITQIVVGITF